MAEPPITREGMTDPPYPPVDFLSTSSVAVSSASCFPAAARLRTCDIAQLSLLRMRTTVFVLFQQMIYDNERAERDKKYPVSDHHPGAA